jgi:hypothetical protein
VIEGVATLDDPGNPTIVAIANNTGTQHDFGYAKTVHLSTLAGIALQAWRDWDSVAFVLNANIQRNSSKEIKNGSVTMAYQTTKDSYPCTGS